MAVTLEVQALALQFFKNIAVLVLFITEFSIAKDEVKAFLGWLVTINLLHLLQELVGIQSEELNLRSELGVDALTYYEFVIFLVSGLFGLLVDAGQDVLLLFFVVTGAIAIFLFVLIYERDRTFRLLIFQSKAIVFLHDSSVCFPNFLVLEDLTESGSKLRVFLKKSFDNLLQVFAIETGNRFRLMLKNFDNEFTCAFGFERVLEAGHVVNKNTKRPNINAFVV